MVNPIHHRLLRVKVRDFPGPDIVTLSLRRDLPTSHMSETLLRRKIAKITSHDENDALFTNPELNLALSRYSRVILDTNLDVTAGDTVSFTTSSGTQLDAPATTRRLQACDSYQAVFPTQDATERTSRWSIEAKLEKEDLQLRSALLNEFMPLYSTLNEIDSTVQSLSTACNEIKERLRQAREATESLSKTTSAIHEQKQLTEQRYKAILHLQSKYAISDHDVSVLTSQNHHQHPIGLPFFEALARVCQIHDECAKTACLHHQRYSLDILRKIKGYLDEGMLRIQRWILDQLGMLSAGSESVSPYFALAFRILRRVPTYYVHCCDELVARRYSVLARRFLLAVQDVAESSPTAYISEVIGKAIATELRRLGIQTSSGSADGTKRKRSDSTDKPVSESGSESESTFERGILYRGTTAHPGAALPTSSASSPTSSSASGTPAGSTGSQSISSVSPRQTTGDGQRGLTPEDANEATASSPETAMSVAISVARAELRSAFKITDGGEPGQYQSTKLIHPEMASRFLVELEAQAPSDQEKETTSVSADLDPICGALANILSIVHEAVAVEAKFLSHVFIDPIEDPTAMRVLNTVFAATRAAMQAQRTNPTPDGARLLATLTGGRHNPNSQESMASASIGTEPDNPLNCPAGLLVRILSAICRPLKSRVHGAAALAVLTKRPISKLQSMRASASVFAVVVARCVASLALSSLRMITNAYQFDQGDSDETAKSLQDGQSPVIQSDPTDLVSDEALLEFWKKPSEESGTESRAELQQLLRKSGFVRSVRDTLGILDRALSYASDRSLVSAMQQIRTPTLRAFAVAMGLAAGSANSTSGTREHASQHETQLSNKTTSTLAQLSMRAKNLLALEADFGSLAGDLVSSAAVAAAEGGSSALIADGFSQGSFQTDPCAAPPELTTCLDELRILLRTLKELPIDPDPFDDENAGGSAAQSADDKNIEVLETIARWINPIEQAVIRACNRFQFCIQSPSGANPLSVRPAIQHLQRSVLALYRFNIHADIESILLPYSQSPVRKKEAGQRLKQLMQELTNQQATSSLRATGVLAKMQIVEAWKVRVKEIAEKNAEATAAGATTALRPIPHLSREQGMTAAELRVATRTLLRCLGVLQAESSGALAISTTSVGTVDSEPTSNVSLAADRVQHLIERTKHLSLNQIVGNEGLASASGAAPTAPLSPRSSSPTSSTGSASAASATGSISGVHSKTAQLQGEPQSSDNALHALLQAGDLAAIWLSERVSNVALRRICKKGAQQVIVEAYRSLYDAAKSAEAGYGRAEFETIFPMTPAAVATALQITLESVSVPSSSAATAAGTSNPDAAKQQTSR